MAIAKKICAERHRSVEFMRQEKRNRVIGESGKKTNLCSRFFWNAQAYIKSGGASKALGSMSSMKLGFCEGGVLFKANMLPVSQIGHPTIMIPYPQQNL